LAETTKANKPVLVSELDTLIDDEHAIIVDIEARPGRMHPRSFLPGPVVRE
jgi:hypothetical protein